MPQYIVLKASSGTVPPDGTTGSADIYIGTHADALTAATAASAKWNLPPAVPLWTDLTSSLTPFHTAALVTPG